MESTTAESFKSLRIALIFATLLPVLFVFSTLTGGKDQFKGLSLKFPSMIVLIP